VYIAERLTLTSSSYIPDRITITSGSQVASELEKLAYAGLCAFVLVLPWGVDNKVVGGLTLASWIALIPIGLATLRIFVDNKVRRSCPIHALLLAFTGWVAASLMWTVDPESTVTRLGTYAQLLIFVWLIWELAPTKARVQGLIVSYVVGAEIASFKTIFNYATGRTISQASGNRWETYRYSVDGVNADELGLIVALSIPMAFYLLTATKNRWIKALCWVQFITGFTAIILSGTRGALFALVVGMIIMSGPALSRMSWTQRSIGMIACVALVSCTALFVPQTSIDRYLSIGTELTQGTMTHRTVLWAAGLQVFRDHPFLGVGAGAYGPAIVRIVDIGYVAHNTFISVLVELGIVGAILLLILLATMLSSVLRLKNVEKWLWLALLATWATGACAVTWEYRKITWLLFGLIAAQAYAKNTGVFRVRREQNPPLVYSPLVYSRPRREPRSSPPPLTPRF
jgi:O-antigen ligase